MQLDPGVGVGLFMPGLWAGMNDSPSSIVDVADRHARLRAASGLPDRLIASPLWASCAVPKLSSDEARLLPADLSYAGHPLFWLPDQLLVRYQISDDELGVVTTESDDTWVVRVLLEASDAGWFDRETGRWRDVLVENGVDVARVHNWLTGSADPQLDELAAPLATDSDWAIDMAQQILPHLRAASDALGALEVRSAVAEGVTDLMPQCAVAGALLGVREGEVSHLDVWQNLHDHPGDAQARSQALQLCDNLIDGGQFSLRELAQLFAPGHMFA